MPRTLREIANRYDKGEMDEEEFLSAVMSFIRHLSNPDEIGKLADTLAQGNI